MASARTLLLSETLLHSLYYHSDGIYILQKNSFTNGQITNDLSIPQKSSFLTQFLKFSAATFCSELFSLLSFSSEQNSESLLLFLFHGLEFRVVFFSAEGFGGRGFREFASLFVPLNGILSCFLFHGRIPKETPRVFCSAEQPEFCRK